MKKLKIKTIAIKLSPWAVQMIQEWAAYELGFMAREGTYRSEIITVVDEILEEATRALDCLGE